MKELPSLSRLFNETNGRDFTMLAINLREHRKKVTRVARAQKLPFPILLDPTGHTGPRYGLQGVPAHYVIDHRGAVIGTAMGARFWDDDQSRENFKKMIHHYKHK